jgi:hypothetical protein
VYDAALHRDYAALRALGGPKFRTGIIGDEDPIGKWEIAFANGEPDPLPRLIRLLETTPGIGPDGSIVYPYIALKDAATWDAADEGLLLRLGFVGADIDAARLKGRYLDERVIFDSTGAWKAFAIGA